MCASKQLLFNAGQTKQKARITLVKLFQLLDKPLAVNKHPLVVSEQLVVLSTQLGNFPIASKRPTCR